jgi:uncharacterized membrane-anchored protein YjiN (DUF445 family)
MGIKIQINSLEALERLIGGDNELEISIRDNIVQEFTNKYLKGLVNSDKIKEASWSINQKIRNCVEETYLSGTYLKPEIVNNIRKEVKDYVDKCLHSYLDNEIDKELRSLMETRIQKLTDSGEMEDRILKCMDSYLKKSIDNVITNMKSFINLHIE